MDQIARLPEQGLDPRHYIGILRRRWPYLLVPAMLIFAGACVLAYKLPRVYEANAKILVESQQIPKNLALPTVTAAADERIQIIQQRLMTRDNLLQILNKFDLFRGERHNLSLSQQVERVREATRIAQIDVGSQAWRRSEGVIGFTVSFQYEDPGVAAQVANELVTSILSQNIQTRLSRAEETSNFFKQQLTTIEGDLLAMEARIAEFKRVHEDALPETLPYRRTLLLQLSGDITELGAKIQLARLPADATGVNGDDRIRQLQRRLQAKELDLTSIREQRETLAPLAEKGFVPENRIREIDRAVAAAEMEIEGLTDDIARGQGLAGGDAVLQQMEEQKGLLEERAAALNDSILRTPQVEVELSALAREYENLQDAFRQAKAKLAEATTGERLEEDRQAERFEVIEQATVPDEPIKPNRAKIVLAGSFGSIAVGMAAVVLLEMMFRSIRTAADLQKALQLRPIVTIPYITTRPQKRRRRRLMIAGAILALAAAVAAVLLVHWFYMPLDLLLDRVVAKLGV